MVEDFTSPVRLLQDRLKRTRDLEQDARNKADAMAVKCAHHMHEANTFARICDELEAAIAKLTPPTEPTTHEAAQVPG